MITGIGTDLVEIARVQKAIGRSAFLEKVYTEKERELIAVRPARAAGNFAAKEAVAKALGSGFAGIAPAEIEVLRNASGMPYVVLHGRAKAKADALGVRMVRISITDTAEYAQAYAVCEGTNGEENGVLPSGCKRHSVSGDNRSVESAGCPVLDAVGMKETDRYTIETVGIPSPVLMERAALAVAERVKEYAAKETPIGVLCGTGNNGGDGVAVARLLKEAGYDARVLLKDAHLYEGETTEGTELRGTAEFLHQVKIAKAYEVPFCTTEETKFYDIIVDALFGIGLSKPVEGEYADLLARLNREAHIIIAVDIPSGVSATDGSVRGVALSAEETVTFGAAKCGHLLYPGKEYTGKLTVADIGFPGNALWERKKGRYLTPETIDSLLPKRPAYSNKGTFGKVAVIAGSKNMAGAAYFAACAAYRTGAGLVKILSPECNRVVLQTLLPEAMLATYTEEEEVSGIVKDTVRFADALVIGPGLGRSEAAKRLVMAVRDVLAGLKEEAPASVWDADALNLISEEMGKEGITSVAGRIAYLERWLPKRAVLTPHPGELSGLMDVKIPELTSDFWKTANEIASRSENVYVLKDAVTLTVKQSECCVNTTGNQGMATGGSGDILCGVIAALLAAGLTEYTAASVGVWLHGAAGDRAAETVGAAPLIARDLLRALGALFEEKGKEEVKHDGV